MTREEQIEKEAKRVSYNTDEYHSFILGAEWVDKTMIDKVCKWLKDNIEEYVYGRDWDIDKEWLTACLRAEIYEEV